MSLCTTRNVGGYVAGEGATVAFNRLYKPLALSRPVISFQSSGGNDRDFLTSATTGAQIALSLVEAGVPFVSAEFGGINLWGNDTCQTRIGQAWTWIKSVANPKADKFIGIGTSKGATALLNYTRNNPANVAALVLLVPAVNVSDIFDNSRPLTSQAEINAAYAGNWAAAKAAHDPALNVATHAGQAIPMKLIYGDSDATVIPSTVTSFALSVGSSAVARMVPGGAHGTTAPAIDPTVDVLPFIAPFLT